MSDSDFKWLMIMIIIISVVMAVPVFFDRGVKGCESTCKSCVDVSQ